MEINPYLEGKIYEIVNENGDRYIGSTIRTLEERLSCHINNFKRYCNGKSNYVSSFVLIEKGRYEIRLLEKYPCENKLELLKQEQVWIDSGECVNKHRAYLSKEDLKEEIKKWRLENLDKIKETCKKYYLENADKMNEKCKIYCLENADKIRENRKIYYQENADKINEKNKKYRLENADKLKAKFDCECGGKYTFQRKTRHFKTKLHIDYEKTL